MAQDPTDEWYTFTVHDKGGYFQTVRRSRVVGEAPFLFCDHKHPTYAEAEACRDFVGER